jgi:hypothetical protein
MSYLFAGDTGAQRSTDAPAAQTRMTPGAPFSLIDAMNRQRTSRTVEALV